MPTIPGLSVTPASWHDASDISTLTIDANGRVQRVLDKSGNGRQLYTSSTDRRPLYTASDARIGGKPSISATRATDILATQSDTLQQTPFDVREVYAVAQYADGTKPNFSVVNNQSGWGNTGTMGDGYSALFGGYGANGLPRMMGNLNTSHFIQTSNFGTGAFRNRETEIRGTGVAPAILPLPLSVLRIPGLASLAGAALTSARLIGGQDVGAARAWAGPWCEFLMFENPLSEADRAIVLNYLLPKWGIESASIAGTLAKTLAPLTTISNAKLRLGAATARTLAPLTSSAAGRLAIKSALAKTLDALTVSSSGKITPFLTGNVSKTLDALTVSVEAKTDRRANISATLDDVQSLSSGQVRIQSTLAGALIGLVLTARAKLFRYVTTPLIRTFPVANENRIAAVMSENRTITLDKEHGPMLRFPSKDPDEVNDYKLDWSARLAGDSIESSTWFVDDGLTVDRTSNDATTTVVWLSGGSSNRAYRLLNRIVTVDGRTMDETVKISVVDK